MSKFLHRADRFSNAVRLLSFHAVPIKGESPACRFRTVGFARSLRALVSPSALDWTVGASFPCADAVTTDVATAALSARQLHAARVCAEPVPRTSGAKGAGSSTPHGKPATG